MKSEPMGLGMTALRRALSPLPKEDIRYVPTLEEEIERIKSVTLDEIKTLYAKQLGASNAEVAAVGDFDADALKNLLIEKLANWKSPARPAI